MYKNQEELAQKLVTDNVITESELESARQIATSTGRLVEQVLLDEGMVQSEQLTKVKAQLLSLQSADLRSLTIDPKVLRLIPQEVSENYKMIAFNKTGSTISIGLVDPQNFKAIEAAEFLAKKSGWKVTYFVISQESYQEAVRQYEPLGQEVEDALADVQEVFLTKSGNRDTDKMAQVIKSAPVSKIVLVIFKHAIDGRASDIHIEPSPKNVKVRYRIDGLLKTSLVLPKYIHAAVVARIKVLANLRLDETRLPQDGRIRLNLEGRDVDLRVSTLPLYEGEKVVMRILDSSAKLPSLSDLGFNAIHQKMINESITSPHGMILLTGPTGSGKTTTLYTLLNMLNKDNVNIVTLEDPIEYYMNGINQSQVNPEVGFSFASGLRAILRQDPNVIMVGEIRDEETAQLSIHASLTGHLMLSTLHTNDAIGAIPRLVDMKAEPFLLSSVLQLIIAQRLARRLCPDCKVEEEVSEHMKKRIDTALKSAPSEYTQDVPANPLFWKGKGCSSCGNTGYRGRVAVAEVIAITSKMRSIISNEGGKESEIRSELEQQHFITLVQDCIIKATQGLTTLEEVVRVSQL